jgi:hypothetical protein
MNSHPCNRLAVSPLVPIMMQRLNGTRGLKLVNVLRKIQVCLG